ncbi:MAG TPA: heparinase II/III family protein [Hyphomicrobiaceae bacterium]|nr:heparinase II/III family protein [Hyphomicrobiaceae bacterium]
MARLKLSERIGIAYLAGDRLRRSALSHALSSPLLRWQFGAAVADQLLIVPQDLRTADPSFWDEVQLGQFGLAGTVAVLDGRSPFDLPPPNQAWARALHGFGWLRHMDAAAREDARATARRIAVEWAMRHRGGSGIAWEPAVAGRRLVSWISHAGLLLEGADAPTYDAITRSLGAQLVRLSASWRDGPSGYPRLLALSALVLADLSIAGHDRQLREAEIAFGQELSHQILPDGGHVSRNPGVLVELMLDFLPLHQCFAARGRAPPPALTSALKRMMSMLRYMRMGDGQLARFNGMAVASPAALATVLAYDDLPGAPLAEASASRYVRLERSGTVVIMDAGPPPPLEVAGEAHAGCLSFELSFATKLMLVNGGAPGPADNDWRPASRATASHNTLCLGEKSSSRLVRHKRLEALVGAPPIRFPDGVEARVEEHGGGLEVVAHHDGYAGRFGLVHRRTLALNESGRRLLGIDRLESPRGNLRLSRDIPFAIHFHLHPDVVCRRGDGSNTAEIVLEDGEVWHFSVEGAALAIEESTYFADSAGPRSALQIAVRGATFGDKEVRWVLQSEA